MTKKELIEKLARVPDDADVADTLGFCIDDIIYFDHTNLVFLVTRDGETGEVLSAEERLETN